MRGRFTQRKAFAHSTKVSDVLSLACCWQQRVNSACTHAPTGLGPNLVGVTPEKAIKLAVCVYFCGDSERSHLIERASQANDYFREKLTDPVTNELPIGRFVRRPLCFVCVNRT